MTSLDFYLIAATFLVVVLGGAVAYFKRDFVSRGMAICFFTSLCGLLALILSPPSKARLGDPHDEHCWPPYSWIAVGGMLIVVMTIQLVRWLV
jgi:hypothetical protein